MNDTYKALRAELRYHHGTLNQDSRTAQLILQAADALGTLQKKLEDQGRDLCAAMRSTIVGDLQTEIVNLREEVRKAAVLCNPTLLKIGIRDRDRALAERDELATQLHAAVVKEATAELIADEDLLAENEQLKAQLAAIRTLLR